MKRTHQRLLILSIIFVVGLAVFFLRGTVMNLFAEKSEEPFSSIKPEEIKKIEIQTENETQQLVKESGTWSVVQGEKKFQADQARVDTLIDAFLEVKKETIASENPERHKQLGIGTQKITVKTDENSYTLFIGNSTQISRNFIRIGDEDTVYVASGFSQVVTPADYRDLTIPFVQNEDEVTSITITDAGIPLELTKKEGEWHIGEEKGDQDKMSFYVNELSVIRASQIDDNDPIVDEGLIAEKTIRVAENGEEKMVEFYPKDETTMYAKRQNGEIVYELSASLVDSLIKIRDDLIPETE